MTFIKNLLSSKEKQPIIEVERRGQDDRGKK